MEMDDFNLMSKGFWDKKKYEQHLLRRVAYIAHASMVSKPLSPDKIWKIDDVESKKKTPEEMKAERDEIMRRVRFTNKILAEKEKNKKKKNGGRA